VAAFVRNLLTSYRLIAGGSLAVCVVLTLVGGGSLASAAPELAQAAATQTPTSTAGGATATAVPCTTPPIGIQIILENPQPGDTLLSGTELVINGIAYDTGSTSGPGISSVTAYLGARDAGGLFLGTALLGQPNPQAAPNSQFANAGFTLRTAALPTGSGGRSIFIYATSLVGNAEATLEVPIFLNAAPTPVRGQVPTAVLPTPPPCTPTPTATATTAPAVVAPAVPAVAATATPAATRPPSPTPFAIATLAVPATVAPAAAATPAPAAAAPAATTPAPVAVAPATSQTTAPRGGGIPSELGVVLVGLGGLVVAAGLAVRRRERSHRRR
jgi:hypothetical protein